MAAKRLTLFTLALLAGCGGGSRDSAAADSLSRDLQLLPVDSSAALDDSPAIAAAPVPEPAITTASASPRRRSNHVQTAREYAICVVPLPTTPITTNVA